MAIGKPVLLIITATMLGIMSLSAAIPGTATYYTPPYNPSSCYGFEDKGVLIAAASDAIWDNRAACGRRYSVTCTGPTNQGVPQPCRGSVVVTIVDYCPAGCQGTIDLSQEAFAAIADPNAGKVYIEYSQRSDAALEDDAAQQQAIHIYDLHDRVRVPHMRGNEWKAYGDEPTDSMANLLHPEENDAAHKESQVKGINERIDINEEKILKLRMIFLDIKDHIKLAISH